VPRTVKVVLNDHSATIVLNRANQLNAFNTQMLRELSEAMDTVAANVDVKALVIESASPKAFSTGLDLSQLESFQSVHEARDFAILLEETMLKVFNFPLPTIARLDGHVYGGGLGLAISCDFRVATGKTQMGFPALRIGAILPLACTIRLNHLVGVSFSRELLFLGQKIDAEMALQKGLINACGDKNTCDTFINNVIISVKDIPASVLAMQKKALNQTQNGQIYGMASQSAENFAFFYSSGNWQSVHQNLRQKNG
jgi:enoyl-CoA hydratase